MTKLLKIGIPILVVVLILILGTGFALAQSKDTTVSTNSSVAYDQDGKQCPQFCQGTCNGNGDCPYAGNCNGVCQGSQGSSCCYGKSSNYQRGNCCGLDNSYNASEYSQQPSRSCCR